VAHDRPNTAAVKSPLAALARSLLLSVRENLECHTGTVECDGGAVGPAPAGDGDARGAEGRYDREGDDGLEECLGEEGLDKRAQPKAAVELALGIALVVASTRDGAGRDFAEETETPGANACELWNAKSANRSIRLLKKSV
jgi:hypothetical protein